MRYLLPAALKHPSGDGNGFRVYRPAGGGRSCEHFGGYKTINRIPLLLLPYNQLKDPLNVFNHLNHDCTESDIFQQISSNRLLSDNYLKNECESEPEQFLSISVEILQNTFC